MSQLPVIFLMGPTASGKTQLAMDLHDKLGCDIVSVDSAMIYKGMDVGTAKPNHQELAAYPHRLIDLIDPAESYSVAEFRRDALQQINDIHSKGRIPLLTGGTMLYFKGLKDGLATLPNADEEVRQRLVNEATMSGWAALHQRLEKIDKESAARLNPNDTQRLQRALEVYELTGKSLTQHWAEQAEQKLPFPVVSMAVMPKERKELHQRIEQRFHAMLEQGFIAEVESLYNRGDLDVTLPSMRCVGYRQVWQYLAGEWDRDTMIEKGVIATRQLAKRQVTWLRSWPDLHWMDTHDSNLCANALKLIDSAII